MLLRKGVSIKAMLIMENPYKESIIKNINKLLGGLKKEVMAVNMTATAVTVSIIIRYSRAQEILQIINK